MVHNEQNCMFYAWSLSLGIVTILCSMLWNSMFGKRSISIFGNSKHTTSTNIQRYILCLHTHTRTYTHVCIYIHINVHMYMYIHTHAHTNIYIHSYICTYIHTYIHTYKNTFIHTNLHAYRQALMQTHIHTYIHTYHTHTCIYICWYGRGKEEARERQRGREEVEAKGKGWRKNKRRANDKKTTRDRQKRLFHRDPQRIDASTHLCACVCVYTSMHARVHK